MGQNLNKPHAGPMNVARLVACLLTPWALALPLAAAAGESPPASDSGLICFGTEPFWSVNLTTPGVAEVSFVDEAPVSYRGGATQLSFLREEIWRGSPDAGRDLVVFLRVASCSDSMSGVEHPVNARVSLPDGRFLAGCCRVADNEETTVAGITLESVTWRLGDLPGTDPQALAAAPRPVTVRFEAGRVSGFSGCNNFMGSYTVAGDQLTIGPLAGTMMACPEPEAAIEKAFHAALSGTMRYSIQGEQLTLLATSGSALSFAAEPPPRLEGVTWHVNGINNNRQAVVGLSGASQITLSFEQGTVSGNAGCNNFHAPYSTEGKRIEIGPLVTTRMACPEEQMVEEQLFLAALQSAVTWNVDSGVLDMHRADGERALMANSKK